MTHKIQVNAALALIFATLCCHAESDEITWRVIDWAPFYIVDGPQSQQGLYDHIINDLSMKLTEYKHHRSEMSTQRALSEIQKGRKICHPSALANTDALLSSVNSFLLPHRIIIKKNQADDFVSLLTPDNSLSLKKLLQSNKLGGLSQKRYTRNLNRLIDQYPPEKFYRSPNYSSLVNMLIRERIDYIVEYTPITQYAAGANNQFSSYAISETQEQQFIPVYIACPDNSWGQAVIKKINLALKKQMISPDFIESRLRWFDSDSKELLRRIYQQEYHKDKSSLLKETIYVD